MIVRERTIFTTSDDMDWDNLQEAESHQSFINLTQFFRDGLGLDLTSDEAALLVWKHRDRVTDILSRALPLTDTEKLSS